jgi:hypothetical protein
MCGALQKEGFRWSLLSLPGIIFSLHINYGVGTAVGLCLEDKITKNKPIELKGVITKTLYWIIELVLLPIKTVCWFIKLLTNR